mgnify:CR=1 FL=1
MTYTTDTITEIFSDEYTLDLWAAIECAALRAQTQIGQVPEQWWRDAAQAGVPHVDQWRTETALSGHEFVAFLMLWGENGARNVHIGLTSSDITDTALGVRINDSTTVLCDAFLELEDMVRALDVETGVCPRLGRTHGQAAVATTYGSLFERWLAALRDTQQELRYTGTAASLGKISGPIGTYQHVDPYVEMYVCQQFGLTPARPASQIVPRHYLAQFVATLGVAATVIESIALELRLLSHAHVGEVTDTAGSTSSAMPHKTNPNRLERLTGLARIARSAYDPITQGIVQWHERDMAHSSVERTLLPQTVGIVHYMATSLHAILSETRFNNTAAVMNLGWFETEVQTHSMQTHLQLKGYSYGDAKAEVSRLLHENIGVGALRLALHAHQDLSDYRTPDTTRKETIDGIL